jgi:hypothetical protein
LVEIADVVDTLRQSSPVKKPTYAAKLGTGCITLPLMAGAAAAPRSRSTSLRKCGPGLLATFSLHVSKNFSKQELMDLVGWLAMMPKSKSAALKLESVKSTNSMLFIFESSYLSFMRIDGMPGVILREWAE